MKSMFTGIVKNFKCNSFLQKTDIICMLMECVPCNYVSTMSTNNMEKTSDFTLKKSSPPECSYPEEFGKSPYHNCQSNCCQGNTPVY